MAFSKLSPQLASKAIALRRQGRALSDVAREAGISKTTLALWRSAAKTDPKSRFAIFISALDQAKVDHESGLIRELQRELAFDRSE